MDTNDHICAKSQAFSQQSSRLPHNQYFHTYISYAFSLFDDKIYTQNIHQESFISRSNKNNYYQHSYYSNMVTSSNSNKCSNIYCSKNDIHPNIILYTFNIIIHQWPNKVAHQNRISIIFIMHRMRHLCLHVKRECFHDSLHALCHGNYIFYAQSTFNSF